MGTSELVIGPKLGVWAHFVDSSGVGFSTTGRMYGLNAAMVFGQGALKFGPLLAIERQTATEFCNDSAGFEECGAPDPSSVSSGSLVTLNFVLRL